MLPGSVGLTAVSVVWLHNLSTWVAVISKSCKTRAATNLHDSNRYKCMNRIYSFQEQTVIFKKKCSERE